MDLALNNIHSYHKSRPTNQPTDMKRLKCFECNNEDNSPKKQSDEKCD